MAGPFGKQTAPSNRPKRNTFDLSHQNNLTMEFGKLYPFLCEPVIPGDSVRLDTAFGIRAMPTAFPLQTKIRADVHYFYVRNRNLWKDWPDFIGQTRDDLVLPYTNNVFNPLSDGSLADYLNIPTSLSNSFSLVSEASQISQSGNSFGFLGYLHESSGSSNFVGFSNWSLVSDSGVHIDNISSLFNERKPIVPSGDKPAVFRPSFIFESPDKFNSLIVSKSFASHWRGTPSLNQFVFYISDDDGFFPDDQPIFYPAVDLGSDILFVPTIPLDGFDFSRLVVWPILFSKPFELSGFDSASALSLAKNTKYVSGLGAQSVYASNPMDYNFFASDVRVAFYSFQPFTADSDSRFNSLKFNALPFRAYESIYNAFYRDDRNNPYIISGQKVYNKYLPNTEGGLDKTVYSLRSRNWEQDFLTTAVDSPQQGIAPLVGISSTGVASFALDDGSIEKVQLKVGDDGDTIVGAEYSNNLSPAVARQLVNVATSGISINDFRGVNALQRWLEINIRRGLKYKDQIESHFGVTPSYAELDMPEFLGGATQWFDSSQVNQTSEASSGAPLGSYAGQLSLVGGSNHPVTRFFDEHGYIIGIISISPVPVYINTLHADFLKSSPLDYYFPEFAHLGYQPIPYAQVSPLETLLAESDLDSTFGYQRAWYEYMSRTDEAHGDFRGSLRDFLLMRRFPFTPSLTESFLTIDPKQLNQVFTVNEIDGKPIMPFLGQIHIKEIFKRPIPRYQITTLE